jgi:hypothetical protein
MSLVDIDGVREGMKERVDYYTEVFGIALENGFGVSDFISLPVEQKYVLRRETLGNITQPGATGSNNYAPSFYSTDTREGELKPGKVDALFTELEIREINQSFMQDIQSSDVDSINSVAGYDYIMDRMFAQTGAEVDNGIYYGDIGSQPLGAPAGAFQAGRNIIDGLGVKFDEAIASGEIPALHNIPKSVAITAANVLPELKKIIDKVYSLDHIRREMRSPRFANVMYKIFCPTEWEGLIVDAFDSLTYKFDQTLRLNPTTGLYEPKKLQRTTLAFRSFMDVGDDEAFFSPTNNLFLCSKKGKTGATAQANCKVKVQDTLARGFQVQLDWDQDVNFGDGRFIVTYKTA